jgi:hypothetical protein
MPSSKIKKKGLWSLFELSGVGRTGGFDIARAARCAG